MKKTFKDNLLFNFYSVIFDIFGRIFGEWGYSNTYFMQLQTMGHS